MTFISEMGFTGSSFVASGRSGFKKSLERSPFSLTINSCCLRQQSAISSQQSVGRMDTVRVGIASYRQVGVIDDETTAVREDGESVERLARLDRLLQRRKLHQTLFARLDQKPPILQHDSHTHNTNLESYGFHEDHDLLHESVDAEDSMHKVGRDRVRRVLHRDEQDAVALDALAARGLAVAAHHVAVAQLLVLGVAHRDGLVAAGGGQWRLLQHAHDARGLVQVGRLHQRLDGAARDGRERARVEAGEERVAPPQQHDLVHVADGHERLAQLLLRPVARDAVQVEHLGRHGGRLGIGGGACGSTLRVGDVCHGRGCSIGEFFLERPNFAESIQ